jgi:DNA-binding NarL/FixJ family response regulator
MCTAVRIVVAAAERERRLELRRATVTAEWEVVGEADGPEAAYGEAVERRARFLVLDASAAGPRPEVLVRRLRSTSPNAFVVGVGEVEGVDAVVPEGALDGLRDAMRDLLHSSGDHQHA